MQTSENGLDGGNMLQFSAQARYISRPRKVQKGSGSNPNGLVVLCLEVNRPGHETDDLAPSTAEVKNGVGHTHDLRTCFHSVHKDNATLKWYCGVNKAP